MILTPLGDIAPEAPSETLHTAHSGHTALEPPSSVLHNVFSAIKHVFSAAPTAHAEETYLAHPPPPPPVPSYNSMAWGAVDSYGLPAVADAYSNYDPHNPHPPFDYATAKKSVAPTKHIPIKYSHGLTSDKLKKVQQNIDKLNSYIYDTQRSSEVHPNFNGLEAYKNLLNGKIQMPTPVVTDNDIGVLPADLLPDSTTTTTTTARPTVTTTTDDEKKRERKDVKYYLRGNKIVLHG